MATFTAASAASCGKRAFSFRTARVFGLGFASTASFSTLSKYCSTVFRVPKTYLLPCSKIGVEAPWASTMGTRCCWMILLTGRVIPLPYGPRMNLMPSSVISFSTSLVAVVGFDWSSWYLISTRYLAPAISMPPNCWLMCFA